MYGDSNMEIYILPYVKQIPMGICYMTLELSNSITTQRVEWEGDRREIQEEDIYTKFLADSL